MHDRIVERTPELWRNWISSSTSLTGWCYRWFVSLLGVLRLTSDPFCGLFVGLFITYWLNVTTPFTEEHYYIAVCFLFTLKLLRRHVFTLFNYVDDDAKILASLSCSTQCNVLFFHACIIMSPTIMWKPIRSGTCARTNAGHICCFCGHASCFFSFLFLLFAVVYIDAPCCAERVRSLRMTPF